MPHLAAVCRYIHNARDAAVEDRRALNIEGVLRLMLLPLLLYRSSFCRLIFPFRAAHTACGSHNTHLLRTVPRAHSTAAPPPRLNLDCVASRQLRDGLRLRLSSSRPPPHLESHCNFFLAAFTHNSLLHRRRLLLRPLLYCCLSQVVLATLSVSSDGRALVYDAAQRGCFHNGNLSIAHEQRLKCARNSVEAVHLDRIHVTQQRQQEQQGRQ